MNVSLSNVYEMVKKSYPNKRVYFRPDMDIAPDSVVRSGEVGNYKVVATITETDSMVYVQNFNIQFICENVPNLRR